MEFLVILGVAVLLIWTFASFWKMDKPENKERGRAWAAKENQRDTQSRKRGFGLNTGDSDGGD